MLPNATVFASQVETEVVQYASGEGNLLAYFPVNFRSSHAFLAIIPCDFREFH